jgi:hypothetical protein
MDHTLALLLATFVALVMLFAQLKLFAIASTLKEILRELRIQNQRGGR